MTTLFPFSAGLDREQEDGVDEVVTMEMSDDDLGEDGGGEDVPETAEGGLSSAENFPDIFCDSVHVYLPMVGTTSPIKATGGLIRMPTRALASNKTTSHQTLGGAPLKHHDSRCFKHSPRLSLIASYWREEPPTYVLTRRQRDLPTNHFARRRSF